MKVLQHEGLLHLEKNRINNMIVIKSGRWIECAFLIA